MSSPFNPRDVEVLAAALPPQGPNAIGRPTRDIIVLHAKRLTPGNYSQVFGTGPAFRTIFFPQATENSHERQITPLTGLDDGFFASLSIAVLCQRMAAATTRLRPQMAVDRIGGDLAAWTNRIRQNSYRYYTYMAQNVDSPIRTALAAFPDDPRRAEAKAHYLAGLTSPTWVNDKILQDVSGNWADRDWELFHHWIKLTAVGATVAEIDAAIAKMTSLGLPVPAHLGPGAWRSQAPWLDRTIGGDDAVDATGPILATKCHVYPGATFPSCMAEDNSFEFTANSQPGTLYRGVPSSSCFAPGTRVVMADSTLRPIEDVAVGDSVLTPTGPRTVILRPSPRRGERVLEQFSGTGFAFAPSHPFMTAAQNSSDAAYAAADPAALARSVPTLGQFGIRPLNGLEPAVLLRRTPDGDRPFPAPRVERVPELRPDLLYDLYIDVGADGRSEYYAGDEDLQVLVSSEIPRFAAAPETTAVVLHVLAEAGPTVLGALANVPDHSFDDLLAIGLDSLARTLMPAVGPHLKGHPRGDRLPLLPASVDAGTVLAANVREFASTLAAAPEGYDQRTGVLVEQFAARFAPQFQATLALPWRTFDLAAQDVASILAVTVYSVETFRQGPPADKAQIEIALVRGSSRAGRRLPVQAGAPADRWYYGVDAPAYFPEWSPPGDGELWTLEVAVTPEEPWRSTIALPPVLSHGYQAFQAPLTDRTGETVGLAQLDVRLLTVEGFAEETRARDAEPAPATAALARLAAEFVVKNFAEALSVFRFCAATTTNP